MAKKSHIRLSELSNQGIGTANGQDMTFTSLVAPFMVDYMHMIWLIMNYVKDHQVVSITLPTFVPSDLYESR